MLKVFVKDWDLLKQKEEFVLSKNLRFHSGTEGGRRWYFKAGCVMLCGSLGSHRGRLQGGND